MKTQIIVSYKDEWIYNARSGAVPRTWIMNQLRGECDGHIFRFTERWRNTFCKSHSPLHINFYLTFTCLSARLTSCRYFFLHCTFYFLQASSTSLAPRSAAIVSAPFCLVPQVNLSKKDSNNPEEAAPSVLKPVSVYLLWCEMNKREMWVLCPLWLWNLLFHVFCSDFFGSSSRLKNPNISVSIIINIKCHSCFYSSFVGCVLTNGVRRRESHKPTVFSKKAEEASSIHPGKH